MNKNQEDTLLGFNVQIQHSLASSRRPFRIRVPKNKTLESEENVENVARALPRGDVSTSDGSTSPRPLFGDFGYRFPLFSPFCSFAFSQEYQVILLGFCKAFGEKSP